MRGVWAGVADLQQDVCWHALTEGGQEFKQTDFIFEEDLLAGKKVNWQRKEKKIIWNNCSTQVAEKLCEFEVDNLTAIERWHQDLYLELIIIDPV